MPLPENHRVRPREISLRERVARAIIQDEKTDREVRDCLWPYYDEIEEINEVIKWVKENEFELRKWFDNRYE